MLSIFYYIICFYIHYILQALLPSFYKLLHFYNFRIHNFHLRVFLNNHLFFLLHLYLDGTPHHLYLYSNQYLFHLKHHVNLEILHYYLLLFVILFLSYYYSTFVYLEILQQLILYYFLCTSLQFFQNI